MMNPLLFVLTLVAAAGCMRDETHEATYFSKGFYSSEESGDMFGYELNIMTTGRSVNLKFTEYAGGGEPTELLLQDVKLDHANRTLAFSVSGLSLNSPGDAMRYAGRITGDGIEGLAEYTRNGKRTTVEHLSFTQILP